MGASCGEGDTTDLIGRPADDMWVTISHDAPVLEDQIGRYFADDRPRMSSSPTDISDSLSQFPTPLAPAGLGTDGAPRHQGPSRLLTVLEVSA